MERLHTVHFDQRWTEDSRPPLVQDLGVGRYTPRGSTGSDPRCAPSDCEAHNDRSSQRVEQPNTAFYPTAVGGQNVVFLQAFIRMFAFLVFAGGGR